MRQSHISIPQILRYPKLIIYIFDGPLWKQNKKKEEKYFDYNVEAWMRFLRSILVFPSFFYLIFLFLKSQSIGSLTM